MITACPDPASEGECGSVNPYEISKRLAAERRSRNMRAVRSSGSAIEGLLRKGLEERGLKFLVNAPGIYGKPDIAFPELKIAVFCDSEFWHGFGWPESGEKIKSNREFWIAKIGRNVERDKEVNRRLKSEGWRVIRFWGKDITKSTKSCVRRVERAVSVKRATAGKPRKGS
jgi:DNA mismatch endonuclease Vsr